MKEYKSVQVLLSTYNGERYLEEQMESLLSQTYKNTYILIRDDGSTDKTKEILSKYESNQNINIMYEKNIGVVDSFFSLLKESKKQCDYFCFSDQDDIWMKNKIKRAVTILDKNDNSKPLMYCSSIIITDENLKTTCNKRTLNPKIDFRNALVENIATGCTIMINAKARDLIIKKLPSHANMHDWWIYMVISALGKVIYDNQSNLLYRQHSENLVGIKTGFMIKWKQRVINYSLNKNKYLLRKQAIDMKRIFEKDLKTKDREVLNQFLEKKNICKRIKYSLTSKVFRQDTVDNIIFKLMIIFNLI